MDEYFLHYIWQFQKLNNKPQLTNGDLLTVLKTGYSNLDAGPDFLEAQVIIKQITWTGSVEVHYKSSDWIHHQHHLDPAYENVILHVVWIHDQDILVADGTAIPTLSLQAWVSDHITLIYQQYMNQPEVIRCGSRLEKMRAIDIHQMMDRAIAERLVDKGDQVFASFEKADQNWEETAYRWLAANFGFKVNRPTFERLAEILPYRILRKQLDQPFQIEALIFGCAGLLQDQDTYATELGQEFIFLQKKYQLKRVLRRQQWKFSRLRPANFPTVRLAQFCALLQKQPHWFQNLIHLGDLKQAKSFFQNKVSDYWLNHFDFGKPGKPPQKIGLSSVCNLTINTVIPLMIAYSKYHNETIYLEHAHDVLTQLPGEHNLIIKKWENHGVKAQNAADSQALLQQYRYYCLEKRCLQCNIGLRILNL